MKQQLLKIIFLGSVALLLTACKTAVVTSSAGLRYEMECAGIGVQGTYLVKVWAYGSERDINIDLLKRYAVHGVIFRGYTALSGCPAQRPMASSPALEQERANFFEPFFGIDKAYNRYASDVGGGFERIRVGNEYKIGTVISVAKDLLRRDLEAAGVIRALSGGF